MNTNASAASTVRAAQDSTAFRVLARIGYVVLGLLHLLIGIIAISIATGGGGKADQGGALAQIQKSPFGVVLLWGIVIGLAALAAWQVAEIFLERDPDSRKRWAHRVKFIGTAITYLAISGTALVYALGGRSDSSESSQSLSARLLAVPAGVALLVAIGLVVTGIGIAFVVRGITRAFEEDLDLATGAGRTGILTLGVVGYVAKGIAVGVTGILFVVAALMHDPEAAGGLDAALRALAGLPFGVVILWGVGAGLILYGLFCFARARYARM
ncbi:DUF1206 domain-containing protein [Microbacterium sp. YMB-B2]|uniref:DUF1206 domain-containing protein n=1 Tax=Microbacterium tenebrionis TaxID=2830665 RepID=A0A9X1LPS1_9MICO|nr:DUF1206 domain-containing protein [Microbacterium tenebrionis]MCC2029664.1 DUF1206 domain-containing protein [Microbacterium tenebrionis]